MKKNYRMVLIISLVAAFIFSVFNLTCLAGQQEVVVMTWGGNWGDSFKKNVAEPFEKKFGIKVIVEIQTGTRAGQTKLRAQKDNPQIDVWTASMGGIEAAGSEGLLTPISDVNIPNIANIYEYGKGKYSVGWYVTPRGIFYRPGMTGFDLNDWKDIWDARLKGKVAIPESTFAGGQFIVLAALLAGGSEYNIEPGFEYLKKLKPNIAVFFKTDAEAIKYLQAGEAAVTAGSLLPNVYPLLGKDSKYKFRVPKSPILVSVDQIGIVNGPKKDLAAKFVDYMLSAEGQEPHCFQLGALPINKLAKLPKDVADLTPPMDVVYNTNFDEVNKHLAAWTDRWNREIKSR